MGEDFDNHRRIFDGGDALQAAAAVQAVFDVDVEDRFEQPGPTQARRRALRVIACGRGCLLRRTGDDFTTQLCVRREHAMGDFPLATTLADAFEAWTAFNPLAYILSVNINRIRPPSDAYSQVHTVSKKMEGGVRTWVKLVDFGH